MSYQALCDHILQERGIDIELMPREKDIYGFASIHGMTKVFNTDIAVAQQLVAKMGEGHTLTSVFAADGDLYAVLLVPPFDLSPLFREEMCRE